MRSSFKKLLPFYLLYLISVLCIGSLGLLLFPTSNIFIPALPDALGNWDGAHFIPIAQDGYVDFHQHAFLPLYPFLIRVLTLIFEQPLVGALVISWSCLLASLVVLYELIKKEYSEAVAFQSLTLMLVFPSSFFLMTAYSESLFLLLTALTFYFLQRNYKYDVLFATLATSLALVTRIFGVALLVSLWVAVLTNPKLKYRWAVLLAPVSFLFYDPMLYLSAEGHWSRGVTISGLNIFSSIEVLLLKDVNMKVVIQWLEYIFLSFGIGLTIRAFRYLKLHYAIYCLVSLVIILISGSLMSTPRFLIVLFPFFIVLAIWEKKSKTFFPWRKLYIFLSISLLIFFIIRFINGYWIS